MGRKLYVGNLPYQTGEVGAHRALQPGRHRRKRAHHARHGDRARAGLRVRRNGDRRRSAARHHRAERIQNGGAPARRQRSPTQTDGWRWRRWRRVRPRQSWRRRRWRRRIDASRAGRSYVPLEKYREKRNFNKTPEPAGSGAARSKIGGQEVQTASSASRNISPAIFTTTSGSSTTACCCPGRCRKGRRSIRRSSASRCTSKIIRSNTANFEGVIPEGYGAGIVMLWDRGTWTPEVDDVDAALKKGDLKFTLDGVQAEGIVGAGAGRAVRAIRRAAAGC